MSGDLKDGMLTIGMCRFNIYCCMVSVTTLYVQHVYLFLLVKCVRSKPAYFAEKLYKSMKVHVHTIVPIIIIIILLRLWLCVYLSVTGGQRKRIDLEAQGAAFLVVERKKLELDNLCECQSRHWLQARTLASLTDRTKTRQ